jgi:hypothetical protein
MALRSEIVKWAIWESDFGEWKPSAEEMQKFFRTVGLDPPTDADMKKFQTLGVGRAGKRLFHRLARHLRLLRAEALGRPGCAVAVGR